MCQKIFVQFVYSAEPIIDETNIIIGNGLSSSVGAQCNGVRRDYHDIFTIYDMYLDRGVPNFLESNIILVIVSV